jgi:hypothetical protein
MTALPARVDDSMIVVACTAIPHREVRRAARPRSAVDHAVIGSCNRVDGGDRHRADAIALLAVDHNPSM